MTHLLALALAALLAAPAAAQPQLSYRILLDTGEPLVVEDEAAAGPLVDDQLATTSAGNAQATVSVDYGQIALTAGAETQGPVGSPIVYHANPVATFEDEITIPPPTAAHQFAMGTFAARIETSGTGSATAGGAEFINATASYSVFAEIGTCITCTFRRDGSWYDLGSENGGAGFAGDPVGTIETGPISFAFSIPFPISVSLSLENQVTGGAEPVLAETFLDLGTRFAITEVRDAGGELVDVTPMGASGAVYVPEPGAAATGWTAAAILVILRVAPLLRLPKSRRPPRTR